MNINNLHEGQTIKNYKDLCVLLEIEPKTSTNSKKAQFKELERYIDYHKESQKIIINKIYGEVKEKMDKRMDGNNSISYIQHIEKLILDLLVQSYHKESVCLSKNKLLKELKMINENYSFCKVRIPKLSKFIGIQQETIDEWYSSTDTTLKNNVEKALDNLRKQSLIIWSNEISVCKVEAQMNKDVYRINKTTFTDEYGEQYVEYDSHVMFYQEYREATDSEKRFIIHTEREILKEMGFKNKSEVVKCGVWNNFKDKVNKIILNQLNIDFYYNSYKILFNQDHILEKYEEFIDDLLLDEKERKETQFLLNKAVSERLNSNINKKKERAIKSLENTIGLPKSEKIKNRTSDNYIEDNTKLINTLINIDTKSIKNKIKKTTN